MTVAAAPPILATREFACTPANLRGARHWVRDLLVPLFGGDHDAVYRVLVCLGELLVNALRHSDSGRLGGTVQVTTIVAEDRDNIRVEVMDSGSAKVPYEVPESVTGEGGPVPAIREDGRGIRMVGQFADGHGEYADPNGRVMWASVSVG